MYLSGVDYESLADGDGVRTVLFISGCKHNCKGCHSPDTHDFKYGTEVTPDVIEDINQEIKKRLPFLSGITLSGGDPMYSAKECIDLLDKLIVPKENVWVFSGFTYEEIKQNPDMVNLLERCNVLVDGPFIEEQRDVSLKFRGSSNQRIIYLDK